MDVVNVKFVHRFFTFLSLGGAGCPAPYWLHISPHQHPATTCKDKRVAVLGGCEKSFLDSTARGHILQIIIHY